MCSVKALPSSQYSSLSRVQVFISELRIVVLSTTLVNRGASHAHRAEHNPHDRPCCHPHLPLSILTDPHALARLHIQDCDAVSNPAPPPVAARYNNTCHLSQTQGCPTFRGP
jgi:hypothetical protein